MMDSEDKKIDIEGVDPRELYGPQNIYLEQMQELHPNLKIIARGSALTVLGPRSDSERFRKRLDGLIAYYLKYGYISKESVQQAFSTGVIEHDAPVDKDVIVYGNNGTIVRARTVNQLKLVEAGVAVYEAEPESTPSEYNGLNMTELREAAAAYGVDASAVRSKKEVIALIEAAKAKADSSAEIEAEPSEA